MTHKCQVTVFLREFKRLWPPDCFVVPRDSNNQALLDLGLTPLQRRDIVMGLTVEHFVNGPVPDYDRPGQELWIFGEQLDSQEIYIKLTVVKVDGIYFAKCLSFHLAKTPMKYCFGQTKD